MFERQWLAVPPQLFTQDGKDNGYIQVVSTLGFRVKASVIIQATGQPNLVLQCKRVLSPTQMVVGPSNTSINNSKIDLTDYTVAAGAFIYQDLQARVEIPPPDILQAVYNQEPICSLSTTSVDQYGNPYGPDNPLPVAFDGTVTIGDVSIVEGGNTMVVEPNGSINVNLEALSSFQTSQYPVGTTAVQITPIPMPDRNSIGFKAITVTSSDAIYIGNSSAVTISTGYPLFNHDGLEMDLEGGETIYAIATSDGQTLCVVELGD